MLQPRFTFLRDAPMPPWMLSAFGEIGQAEVQGAKSNPRIIRYRQEAKVPLAGDDGAVPWCAIFTNAMLERNGGLGSKSGMARSYTSDSDFVRLSTPALGCIVVLSSNRGPASGHVGFYAGEDGLFVHLLGGNQNDAVNISAFQKKRVVGYFWPRGRALPRSPWDKAIRLARPQLPHEKKAVRDD
jgi:uncharacterized protein (TIGR02594 family)